MEGYMLTGTYKEAYDAAANDFEKRLIEKYSELAHTYSKQISPPYYEAYNRADDKGKRIIAAIANHDYRVAWFEQYGCDGLHFSAKFSGQWLEYFESDEMLDVIEDSKEILCSEFAYDKSNKSDLDWMQYVPTDIKVDAATVVIDKIISDTKKGNVNWVRSLSNHNMEELVENNEALKNCIEDIIGNSNRSELIMRFPNSKLEIRKLADVIGNKRAYSEYIFESSGQRMKSISDRVHRLYKMLCCS